MFQHATEFVSSGMTLVPFYSDFLITCITSGFDKFLAEPEEYTDLWEFDVDGDGDPDDGYIRRSGGEYDCKSFFHFRPKLFDCLLDRGVDFQRHFVWLSDCQRLYSLCVNTELWFAEHLDKVIVGYNFSEMLRDEVAKKRNVLRLLSYDVPEENGGMMGKYHQDRSFLTIHIWESHPGLRVGADQLLYKSCRDTALLFPGKKAAFLTGGKLDPETKFFSGGDIEALVHGIKDESKLLSDCGASVHNDSRRRSVVFFGHVDVALPE